MIFARTFYSKFHPICSDGAIHLSLQQVVQVELSDCFYLRAVVQFFTTSCDVIGFQTTFQASLKLFTDVVRRDASFPVKKIKKDLLQISIQLIVVISIPQQQNLGNGSKQIM